eukprot:c29887_g1_i1 orf=225-911(+)
MRIAEMLSRHLRTDLWRSAFVFLWFCICLLFCLFPHPVNSLSSDGVALLEIKNFVESDPLKLLSDWKENDSEPCSWSGVHCDGTSRVVSLNISGNAFYGLSGDSLDNQDCRMCGSESRFIPGSANRISTLVCPGNDADLKFPYDFKRNHCSHCKLAGSLPSAIGNLSQLRTLSLPFHGFRGEIPKEIGTLEFLEVVNLAGNSFAGALPSEFGQLSRLRVLNLAYNSLE